jgi:hypothetical protein
MAPAAPAVKREAEEDLGRMVRRIETFPPATMGHIRSHGCRDLLVYCGSGRCHHSATMNGDCPDDGPFVRYAVEWLARAVVISAPMSGPIGRRTSIIGAYDFRAVEALTSAMI